MIEYCKIFSQMVSVKKILIMLTCIGICACSCNSNVNGDKPVTSFDSLTVNVLHAIMDTSQSYLGKKSELFALIDTMQYRSEFSPDDNIRINAKNLAQNLEWLMLDTTLNTPEELQFFYDSVLFKTTDVKSTWYIERSLPGEDPQWATMVQHILRHEDNINYITEIDVHIFKDKQRAVIYFPEDAVANPTIMFGKEYEDFQLDTISFHKDNALALEERTETTDMTAIFDEGLINAMLTHPYMLIGYVNDDESATEVEERFRSCMVLLNKFQEQYKSLVLE